MSTETAIVRSVVMTEWDRDYHTVTDTKTVTDPTDVEDDWSGYNYWYRIPGNPKMFNANEARQYLSGGGYNNH